MRIAMSTLIICVRVFIRSDSSGETRRYLRVEKKQPLRDETFYPSLGFIIDPFEHFLITYIRVKIRISF